MIKVDNLVKEYGDFRLDVSLEIPDGTVTGLIGKNGAGKSTTIKSILGLIRPDKGLVTINGREVSALTNSEKCMIGAAMSDSGFSMYLSAEDVIHILKKMYPLFDEAFFRKKCSDLGLPLNKQIKDYSTGMRAKLRVLIAISHKAQILIMDEPTAGLDIEARNETLDLLRHYLAENDRCSILITSHISSDLEGLCDDIYMISDGKVVVHEDTDVILGSYALLKMDPKTYDNLDKSYVISTRRDHNGVTCLTNERQFYTENYPDIIIENGNIDDLILYYSQNDTAESA
ncbi:MAG: ABC transporter ATP-binding protein [Butyrivibrio sp.]|nr:ABC transporter ATP-binding protein [Butyrivibrio sp.]